MLRELVAQNLMSIIYADLQKWSEVIQHRLLFCCAALNLIISKQNI